MGPEKRGWIAWFEVDNDISLAFSIGYDRRNKTFGIWVVLFGIHIGARYTFRERKK